MLIYCHKTPGGKLYVRQNDSKSEEDLAVTGSQTGRWTSLFKKVCPRDAHYGIIERVNMMTPELIHVNSFMFEPLIDMSIYHLIQLYKDCKEQLK